MFVIQENILMCYIERHKRLEMKLKSPFIVQLLCSMLCIQSSALAKNNKQRWTPHGRQGCRNHYDVFNILPQKEEFGFVAKEICIKADYSRRQKKATLQHQHISDLRNITRMEVAFSFIAVCGVYCIVSCSSLFFLI
jgi:hypothetical protein